MSPPRRKNDRLCSACRSGNLALVKELVKEGIKPRGFDDKALDVACKAGHLDIAQFLVDCGADVRSHSSRVLHGLWKIEDSECREKVFTWLIEHGAEINLAFVAACEKGCYSDLVFLHDHGASAKTTYGLGEVCTTNPSIDSARFLLDHGSIAGFFLFQELYKSTYFLCGLFRLEDKVKPFINLLLEYNVTPNVSGSQPLQIACAEGHLKVVQYLYEHGANLNPERKSLEWEFELTPLEIACKCYSNKMVEFLLQKGVNPNTCFKDWYYGGETETASAFSIAYRNDNRKIDKTMN